jgi:hypothetical protein
MIWNEAVMAKSRYYPGNFLEELRKTFKTLSQDSRFLAEIRTEHLKNMTSEFFHYASPLGIAELMYRETGHNYKLSSDKTV